MTAQLRSELLKLVTVRTTWIFAGATTLLIVALVLLQAGASGGELLGPLDDVATQQALFATAGVVPIIAIVLGTLVLTTEFRHHTIASTLLVSAGRLRVVAAKAGAGLAVGATLGAVAVLAAGGAASLVLMVARTPMAVSAADLVGPAAGTIAAAGLGALFGLGVGGVARNQALAVGTVLILLLAIEPLAASFLPEVAVWLPSSLATALAEATATAERSLGAAALALAGYGLVTTAGAALALRRADIT